MKNLKKYETDRIIYTALCIAALIGFMLPAVSLSADFFGNTINTDFSARSLFESPESRFGGSDLREADLFNLSGGDMFDGLFADIAAPVIRSAAAYFVVLILLIALLVLTAAGKLTKLRGAVTAASLALFIYAGRVILSVPEIAARGLEDMLGFLAAFINVRDLFELNLGAGYWLTLTALCCLFLLKSAFFLRGRFYTRKTGL